MRIPIVIVLLLLSIALYSQQRQFVFKHFTKDDRLASNRINFTKKDHKGFLWFSTSYGLQNYDGKLMVSFTHDDNDSSSLPDNNAGILMEDRAGRMWVTGPSGISIFNSLHNQFDPVYVDYKPQFDVFSPLNLVQDSKEHCFCTSRLFLFRVIGIIPF